MGMRALNIIAIYIFSVVLLGCGPTANVKTVKTTDKDLSTYDSFAFLPNGEMIPGEEAKDEEIGTMVIDAIIANMRQAGYALDQENPDLLVLADASTDLEQQTTRQPVYASYPYRYPGLGVSPFYSPYFYYGYANFPGIIGYTQDTSVYEDGTLVIHLVDREIREVVWKGIASDKIFDLNTTEAITNLVDEIFEEYPLNN